MASRIRAARDRGVSAHFILNFGNEVVDLTFPINFRL
jgi:hypothetical protein